MKPSRTVLWTALLLAALLVFSGCNVLQRVLTDENVQQGLLQMLTDALQPGKTEAPPLLTPAIESPPAAKTGVPEAADAHALDERGAYTARDDVALYLHTYGRLPDNFMTKAEAGKLGWSGGPLEKHAPGMCIGGDVFGNREGLLPEKKGRTYYECDIDTLGANGRGAKRIVFSNDGLIYYTDDHYASFTLLYGEE